MGLTRSSVRRAATGLASAGLLAGMLLLVAPSSAANAARPAVNDAQLAAAAADLDATARIPGTAWVVNPVTRQVEVTADESVTDAQLDQLKATTSRHGGAVSLVRTSGTISTTIAGGQAIYTGGARCSLGFNVVSGTTYYFLTAGHCTNIGANWYTNSTSTTLIGPRAGTSFPGNDYGIVRYSNTAVAHPGTVYTYSGTQEINSAGTAVVGQSACRSGSTTGVRCGTVTGVNATVNYSQGTVTGLIRTNICAEPGDSGGSLYSGTVALGLTSGGSGNCTSGGTTYFQPVTEALSVYGVSIF